MRKPPTYSPPTNISKNLESRYNAVIKAIKDSGQDPAQLTEAQLMKFRDCGWGAMTYIRALFPYRES
jgi:hypothetical protein